MPAPLKYILWITADCTPEGVVHIAQQITDTLHGYDPRPAVVPLPAHTPGPPHDPAHRRPARRPHRTRQIDAASYYRVADNFPAAAKPYALIVRALARQHQAAIVKFAVRGYRERLGMLRPVSPALNTLRWSGEVRSTDELLDVRTSIPDLVDHYARDLDEVIEAKREGHAPPQASATTHQPDQILDLMAALQDSVAKAKASRGQGLDEAAVHELPKKKAASKKQPARRAPPRETSRPRRRHPGVGPQRLPGPPALR